MTTKHDLERMARPTEPGHIELTEARLAERGESLDATWLDVAIAQRIAADRIRDGFLGEDAYRRGELYLEHRYLPGNVVPIDRARRARG